MLAAPAAWGQSWQDGTSVSVPTTVGEYQDRIYFTDVPEGFGGAVTYVSGSVPPGISYNLTSCFSQDDFDVYLCASTAGTPTATGSYSLHLRVTWSAQSSDLVINFVSPLSLSGTLPPAVESSTYSSGLTASGGVAPYTWSRAGGSLPMGLSLSPSTGLITGVPYCACPLG